MFSFFFNTLLVPTVYAKTVYIVPYPGAKPHQQFFNPLSSQDEFAKKWVCLREALEKSGYTVKFTFDAEKLQDVTAIISITNINSKLLNNLKAYPKNKCWLFILEPPVFLPNIYDLSLTKVFGKIFVMFDDIVDNKSYFKFYYPQPRQQMNEEVPDFSKKKLCVVIAGNKDSHHPQALYSERRKIISVFSKLGPNEFDLYGHGWEGYKNWKGVVKKKWDVLKNYKFCICYENMKDQEGYITEKIFDCFVAGCVPVYWGASNITDYVPRACFIDRRDFASERELYLFLKYMRKDVYEGYLEAIVQYFDSPEAQLFSIDHFIEIIKNNLSKIKT